MKVEKNSQKMVYFSNLYAYHMPDFVHGMVVWTYIALDAYQHGTWHGLNDDGAFWVMETELILVSSSSNQAIVSHQGTIRLYVVVYIIATKVQTHQS